MPGDSLDGLSPVVGGGLVQQQTLAAWSGKTGRRSSDTLLGFETTSPRVHPGEGGCRLLGPGVVPVLGVLVVALLWWWGVVFDLWIVVASI
jgi:hypothetical protein